VFFSTAAQRCSGKALQRHQARSDEARSAENFKICSAKRCTLNKVPIPGFARIKNAFVRPQYGNLVCALEKLKVGYL
jgi:hypothetical protein